MTAIAPRVIFVNRVYWPSTEATAQLLTDLAEGLAARGWSVQVIATGDGPAIHNRVNIHYTGAAQRHGGLLSRIWNFHRFQRDARRRLAAVAKLGDIVVVMTDPPLLGIGLTPVTNALGLRLVLWLQDIYPEIATVHFGRAAALLLTPQSNRRDATWRAAAACVTLGEDMIRTVTQRGVDPARTVLIPNWAPRELHQPVVAEAVLERRRAWSVANKFVVAYSGNLGRVHEFATVIDAATRLRHQPEIEFLLIGHGARFAKVAAVARQRGLGNMRLLPPESRERLPCTLATADAHLVTLRPEYANLVYPSKLAGVLAAGRPVLFVGPSGGDIGSLIRRTNCGAVFAPGDAIGLAETLTRWQADLSLIRTMGTAARSVYEQRFTFESALNHWDALLRRIGLSTKLQFAITEISS